MTVYEAAIALVREAMTGDKADFERYDQNFDFWNKVYTELKEQAVAGITADAALSHHEIPETIKEAWKKYRRKCVANYCYLAIKQREACELLSGEGIPVAVMKGMAAAIYYPVPETRSMGDIDLIVKPTDYDAAIKVLKEHGYKAGGGDSNAYHIAMQKSGVVIELHRSPGIIKDKINGKIVRKYILSGLNHIEENYDGLIRFPILPAPQNGMELIWHVRQHLYNGLGLRQILDWMMYVRENLDDEQYCHYREDLEKCGLNDLAVHVARMCQKYLGLQEDTITWCKNADEKTCDELMTFIMDQGNFGQKKIDEDKRAKVLSGYTGFGMLTEKLQKLGEREWGLLEKYPHMKPLAWIYEGFKMSGISLKSGGIASMIRDLKVARQRRKMFKKLYRMTSTKNEIINRLLCIWNNLRFYHD